ncbi:hypothetical protein SAMN05421874_128130 [Nonomuraea maritima]|uniref:Uncharacterized protein n=1 Tax=Nonomuraea maritima TaxID=683260 RepID=A0A1G9MPN8_9ACTN|nr:hypothetical protein SAMN05421874_128130 [Nonomuraea maritima]
MTDARQWAALAREWLAVTSPNAARAMQARELEARRSRHDAAPEGGWRWKRADHEADEDLEHAEWATEPEVAAGPSPEEIEAAKEALRRETSLARARARARSEREGRSGDHA